MLSYVSFLWFFNTWKLIKQRGNRYNHLEISCSCDTLNSTINKGVRPPKSSRITCLMKNCMYEKNIFSSKHMYFNAIIHSISKVPLYRLHTFFDSWCMGQCMYILSAGCGTNFWIGIGNAALYLCESFMRIICYFNHSTQTRARQIFLHTEWSSVLRAFCCWGC